MFLNLQCVTCSVFFVFIVLNLTIFLFFIEAIFAFFIPLAFLLALNLKFCYFSFCLCHYLITIHINRINQYHYLSWFFCLLLPYSYPSSMTLILNPIKLILKFFIIISNPKAIRNLIPFILKALIKLINPNIQSYHLQAYPNYHLISLTYLHQLDIHLTCHLLLHFIQHLISPPTCLIISFLIWIFTFLSLLSYFNLYFF